MRLLILLLNFKHIWDIVINKDTIWVQWVQQNLIKGKDFWLLKTLVDASRCWRRILDHREAASKFVLHLIGNGRGTKLWKDRWLPQGNLLSLFPPHFTYDTEHHIDATVSSCLLNDAWSLSPNLVNVLGSIGSDVMSVKTDHFFEDRVVWTASKSGDYTLKDTYNAIRPHSDTKEWHSLVWFSNCIPRQCFISWIALHRGLKTRFKLLSWGMSVDPVCALCNLMLEDDFHLLFKCCYAVTVWSELMILLGLRCVSHSDWESQIQWCVIHLRGDSSTGTIRKLSLNAYIYHIWVERNRRIFTQKALPTHVLLQRIREDVRLKLVSVDAQMEENIQNRVLSLRWNYSPKFYYPNKIETTWVKPMIGEVAINTDGAYKGNSAGFGAIIRDDKGEPFGAVYANSEPVSVIAHELQGAEAGLKLAIKKGAQKVSLRMDSMTAVSLFSRPNAAPPWTFHHTWMSIQRLRNSFQAFTVCHSFREVNRAAHHLANASQPGRYEEIDPSDFSEDLKRIVQEDAMGKIYMRNSSSRG